MRETVLSMIQKGYFSDGMTMDNFYTAWEKSKKAKAGLRELLGGEEYRFTYKTSPVEIESKYRSAFFAVRVMSRGSNLINKDGFISTEDIINNKVKGRKISRHIIKSKIVPEYMPCVLDGKGLGAAGESTETLLTTEDFFREFYEKISAERECEVVLSTNFIDIISAGNLSGAESCYSMSVFRDKITDHGGTSSAPFAYAQDGQTLIAYVKHPSCIKEIEKMANSEQDCDEFYVNPSFAGNWPTVELNSVVIGPPRIKNMNIT